MKFTSPWLVAFRQSDWLHSTSQGIPLQLTHHQLGNYSCRHWGRIIVVDGQILNLKEFNQPLTSVYLFQRQGMTLANSKSIYCPSMKVWGPSTRFPEAYAMNAIATATQGGLNPDLNGLAQPPTDLDPGATSYWLGDMIENFINPSYMILVAENERIVATVQAGFPYNALVFGVDPQAPPWCAAPAGTAAGYGDNHAFRHKLSMNILCIDGHSETVPTPSGLSSLNVQYWYAYPGAPP